MKKLLIVLLCAGVCFGLVGCGSKSYDSAMDVLNEFKDNKDISKFIKKTKEFTKSNDPNGMMGEENLYISKVSWEDKRVETADDDKYNGGTIELFNNSEDAKLRKEYFEYYSKKINQTFTKEEYGEEFLIGIQSANKVVKQKGNAIIAVSATLNKNEVSKYFDLFENVLKDYEFKQDKVPSKKEVKKISDKNKKLLDDTIGEMKHMVDEQLNALAEDMESQITELEKSLDESLLSQIEFDVEEFNVSMFKEKYDTWVKRIDSVSKTISDNKKAAEEKAQAEKKAAAEREAAEKSASIGKKNALNKARSYLDSSSFSYSSLFDQLKYEGFTDDESKFAVDNCGADWNKQAASKAKSYMESSSFSRQGLIDQLLFEGFSQEQAVYGVTAVGY